MNRVSAVTETSASRGDANQTFTLVAAIACSIWYTAVTLVCAVGYTQLRRHYSSPPQQSKSSKGNGPHVTVIRPVKGLEPSLYQCLEATFLQDYPREKLTICLCVSDRQDPAFPILQRLVKDYADFDAHVLVEDEDPELQGHAADTRLGPNPKIRNMSRAYREAKGDIIWIIDCNVWVNKGACGRMIDTLVDNKNKFVHLLPLVVDVAGTPVPESAQHLLSPANSGADMRVVTTSSAGNQMRSNGDSNTYLKTWNQAGGRIEELFMSSSHAKFYTAINTVLIAPCIVGKSTMFRKSHLDSLTQNQGIDFFSQNICEDHLIGDLLWKGQVSEEKQGERWGKHAQVFGDLAIQPMAGMSIPEYIARRSRWLRVRKFTVTLATLVEPGTESFLCSLYGAFAITTLPFFNTHLGIPRTWSAFSLFWLASVALWCYVDWTLYITLHSGASIQVDKNTPVFARPPAKDTRRRSFRAWFAAWFAREALALPIWSWAVFGGVTVVWRGKKFWVGMDMRVHEIEHGRASQKSRTD